MNERLRRVILVSGFALFMVPLSSFWSFVNSPFVPLWAAASFAVSSGLRFYNMRKALRNYRTK